MADMIDIIFDKLYRYDRLAEHCGVCIPVGKGKLYNTDKVSVYQDGRRMPSQTKVTSRYTDGSVRYMYVRFQADLPGNKGAVLKLALEGADDEEPEMTDAVSITNDSNGYTVDTGALKFTVRDYTDSIFECVSDGYKEYTKKHFEGPYLKDGEGRTYGVKLKEWRIVEKGRLCTVLAADGSNVLPEGAAGDARKYDFQVRLTAYAGKPWVEVSYRLINTSGEKLHVASLCFYVKAQENSPVKTDLSKMQFEAEPDSTGCGDKLTDNTNALGPVYLTRGTHELPMFDERIDVAGVRTIAAASNYKTDFFIGRDGTEVNRVIDDNSAVPDIQ